MVVHGEWWSVVTLMLLMMVAVVKVGDDDYGRGMAAIVVMMMMMMWRRRRTTTMMMMMMVMVMVMITFRKTTGMSCAANNYHGILSNMTTIETAMKRVNFNEDAAVVRSAESALSDEPQHPLCPCSMSGEYKTAITYAERQRLYADGEINPLTKFPGRLWTNLILLQAKFGMCVPPLSDRPSSSCYGHPPTGKGSASSFCFC